VRALSRTLLRVLPRALSNVVGPLLAVVALITAGYLYLRFGNANLVRLASSDMGTHVDFDSFWRSAVALRHHTDLYRTGSTLPNLDPPVLAVLLAPLAGLDALTAYHAFALLNAVLVVGSVIVVADRATVRPGWAMVAVAALLMSSPLQGTVALGQVYGLLTAALTVAWLAQRHGRSGWAGVALGLAVALKPSLVPLLLWPLLRRDRRTLLAALGAGAVATAVGIVAGGWTATVEWLRLLGSFQVTGYLDNDSLVALAVRFHLPSWPGYLVGGVLLGITLWRAPRRPDHAVWSIASAALLLAPVAWNNYLVLLAPSVPMLLGRRQRRAAVALLALPVIGIEWVLLLPAGDSILTRSGMSLYCGMLLSYWAVLTFAPVRDDPGDAFLDWSVELDAPASWLGAPRVRAHS
jgi:Glycosyltransferase family 87